MRKLILLVWCLLPVGALAYHFGPGQPLEDLDAAASKIAQAEEHVSQAREAEACDGCDADESLATGRRALRRSYRASFPRSESTFFAARDWSWQRRRCSSPNFPEAHQDLIELVDDLNVDANADQDTLNEARSALANAKYYRTWLMRLEGHKRDVWEPEIEAARQTYKLLAAEASARGEGDRAKKAEEDLESAIRLARMDINELQGLPLPSE